VKDVRAAKLGFENSLTSLQTALTGLSTEKDYVREKIMMTALIQQQMLEKQQVCSDMCYLQHEQNNE